MSSDRDYRHSDRREDRRSHKHQSRKDRYSQDQSEHSTYDNEEPPAIPESLRQRFQRLASPDVQAMAMDDDFMVDNVPLVEDFADHLIPLHIRVDKFFDDIRVDDRVAAQVRTTSAIMIEIELLCMTTRFRRILETLKLGRFKVMHDRTIFDYHSGDIIEVEVAKLDDPQQRLGFEIIVEQAPLTATQLPLYYRNAARRRQQVERQSNSRLSKPFPTKLFAENAEICCLAANPSAVHVYGFPRRLPESVIPSLHRRHPLRPEGETAESLRNQQHAQVAEMHVRRAGEYIRNQKNFEAIQCCNTALQLQPENLDALLGRAIAANNMENFAGAIADLDRILKAAPNHSRALGIIDKVLVQQAEKYKVYESLEEKEDFEAAIEAYERALKFAPENFGAQNGLKNLKKSGSNSKNGSSLSSRFQNVAKLSSGTEIVDLTGDDDNQAPKSSQQTIQKTREEDDPIARKKRLAELENFKAMLAKRVKR
ncbi:Tetratricopeptide repeat protein 14 isoform X2 [Aphelenchoides besseyi]|nr:Tetratricopeptide repeat protein 14 isoform X2 [Aphelenchoides besseyi]KAI6195160.1 Tetratricopeptide repeat protein 14 isoform X2 [Aphelenchoides besseyi]